LNTFEWILVVEVGIIALAAARSVLQVTTSIFRSEAGRSTREAFFSLQ
jgi:hypothetical protein